MTEPRDADDLRGQWHKLLAFAMLRSGVRELVFTAAEVAGYQKALGRQCNVVAHTNDDDALVIQILSNDEARAFLNERRERES